MQDDKLIIEEKSYSVYELYYMFLKHIKLVTIIFIFIVSVVIYYNLTVRPTYESSSIIMVSKNQNSMSLLDLGITGERNFIDNEKKILKSRTTSELVVRDIIETNKKDLILFENVDKLYQNLSLDDKINFYTRELRKNITIISDRKNDALTITVKSHDPEEAAFIANKIVNNYKKRDLKWVTGDMSHLKNFLIDQLLQKEIELNAVEQDLKDFQEEKRIFQIDDNANIILKNLTEFETEYYNTLASLEIIEQKEKFIKKQLTDDEIELSEKISNTINEKLSALRNEMSILEMELVSTNIKYGSKHTAAIETRKKIENVKGQIKNVTNELISGGVLPVNPIIYRQSLMDTLLSIKSVKSSLNSKSSSYKKLVDKYNTKLSHLPEKILEFTKLERIRKIHANTYSFMRQKLEEARIGEASKLSKIRVIDKAVPNPNPVKTEKLTNIFFGIVFGLVCGVAVAFIYEFFDSTIKSIEQLERRGLSILSMIPDIGSDKNNNKKTKKYFKKNINVEQLQRRLIIREDPKSPVSEAYRSLRTALMYTTNINGVKQDTKCQIILVSSPGPGEGKTTTIANLAITYANLGKKTLLIDSDLRKPVVHKLFNKDKSPGLSSYLSANSNFDAVVNKTDIENLSVIPSGVVPPNPSEILDSEKMKSFINEVKDGYDVILFDSPPLIAVTDAYVLLKYINQFVLVVRAGVTQVGALERIITSCKQNNFKITGSVMNAMSEQHSYGAGYYYNYYQYYYSEDSKID